VSSTLYHCDALPLCCGATCRLREMREMRTTPMVLWTVAPVPIRTPLTKT